MTDELVPIRKLHITEYIISSDKKNMLIYDNFYWLPQTMWMMIKPLYQVKYMWAIKETTYTLNINVEHTKLNLYNKHVFYHYHYSRHVSYVMWWLNDVNCIKLLQQDLSRNRHKPK